MDRTGELSRSILAADDDPLAGLDASTTLPAGSEPRRSDETCESLRGRVIGRYVVLGRLGAGAMGMVVAAHDPELDRKVALKLLLPHHGRRAEVAQRRLLAEAQALARLSDPHVVAVHDVGTHEDRVFVAMEFVEGQTLQKWLAAERRPWPRVLEVMLAAGRGLAAAHARGLVHRDFKPANVMLGRDGRVRVMDFGLALVHEEPSSTDDDVDDEHARPRDLALGQPLTQHGALLGTPGYMAPEQLASQRGGPAADQFSFCVSLWEGLYGQRPFVAESLPELFSRVRQGEIEEPPSAAEVPRWLRRIATRGLAVEPTQRWPSMTELLDALERGRARGRRRGLLALGLAGLGVAGSLVIGSDAPEPCGGAQGRLVGIWDEPTRAAVTRAFEATGMPYADDARGSVERALDAYAERWAELRTDTCEATRVRGDQSEALMDLRIGCLDGRLRDVAALTAVLAQADADVVKNAAQATQALPSLDECRALERDDASLRPADPELAAAVEGVQARLAQATALTLAGKLDDASTVATDALAAARRTEHRPAIAEAARTMAQVRERQMSGAPAREAYEEALHAALASGHGAVEARALIGLLSVWGTLLGDTEAALRYGRQADAVLDRLGRPPDLDAALALYRGNALMLASRLEAALEQFQRAVALSDGVPNGDWTHLAALSSAAAVQGQQGNHRDALATFTRTLALAEAWLGPWHPTVGAHHTNLGVTYVRLEDYERSLRHAERAREIFEKTLGPDHPELGRAYHNLGTVQSLLERHQAAYETYLEALAIKRRGLGPDHVSVALSANNVCDALVELDRAADAIPYCDDALRIWTKAQGERGASNLYALVGLSDAHLALGRAEQAMPYVRRALEIAEDAEIDPGVVADARFTGARAVWASGGDRQEALALAEQARRAYQAADQPPTKQLAAIDAWLAGRR
jgi:eukaryotic-like serine/threonine-protein kinase